jgi:hypothetical protein
VTTVSNKLGEGFLGEFLVHDKLVRIYQGDITNLVADVIVSSDDTYLQMNVVSLVRFEWLVARIFTGKPEI